MDDETFLNFLRDLKQNIEDCETTADLRNAIAATCDSAISFLSEDDE